MKKVLTLVLTSLMLVSTLAGCTSKPSQNQKVETGKDSSKEHMEISIAHWEIEKALAGKDSDKVLQKLEKDLNITIKPVNTTWDDYSQKIQLWSTSKQLPDLFSIDAIGTSNYNNWINKGIVKALPTDLSKYPKLKEYLNVSDIEALKKDGKLYNIPRKTWDSPEYNALDRLVVYRWDLAQAAGITKEPTTWEEFQAMLKAIKEKDPEKKNIAGLSVINPTLFDGFFFTYSLPAAMSDGSGSDYKWIEKDGKYVPTYFANDPLPTFKLARDMYTKGLIDPDVANAKTNISYDKFRQGQISALVMSGSITKINNELASKWKDLYPNKKFEDSVKILAPLPAADGNKYYSMFKTYWSELYINGSVSDAKRDRIMQMIEYFLSDEYTTMLRFGIEGEDYTKENGQIVRKPDVNLGKKYPFTGVGGFIEWDQGTSEFKQPTIYPATKKMGEDYMKIIKSEGKAPKFDMRFTYMSTPLKDKFVIKPADDLLQIMMGKDPVEKMWGDIYNKYKSNGLDKMVDEVNAEAKKLGYIK